MTKQKYICSRAIHHCVDDISHIYVVLQMLTVKGKLHYISNTPRICQTDFNASIISLLLNVVAALTIADKGVENNDFIDYDSVVIKLMR